MTSVAASVTQIENRRLGRVAVLATLTTAGALATAVSVAAVLRSPVLMNPTSNGILRGSYVAAFIAVGAYTWWRRPESLLGLLLAGVGFLYALTALNASGDSLTWTFGMTVWAAYIPYVGYVYLCFPRSRPDSRLERSSMVAYAGSVAAVWFLILVLSPSLPRAGVFNNCGANCPHNALQVFRASGGVQNALAVAYGAVSTVGLLVLAMLIFAKSRSPSRLRRRTVEPLSYLFVTTIVAFVVYNTYLAPVYPGTRLAFLWVQGGLSLAAPVAILAGQVRGRLFAATSVGKLFAATEGMPVGPDGVQAIIREALGDPTSTLAVVDPRTGEFVDPDGETIEREGRAITPVIRDGRAVAALFHDPALDADETVVEGLAASSLLLLENARLVEELKASRGRIVAAVEEERWRLERDLHDGAQQRLMAIQIKLALLQDRIREPEVRGELEEIAGDSRAAIDELRGLAHGIYPAVLRERGLADGLRALARTAALPVEVLDGDVGRCPPAVEAAVYFCAAEAIQNATKHAGDGARITVTLARRGESVEFAVVDDGAGFQKGRPSEGLGLLSMSDRIGAVGGEVFVSASPGHGTAIRGLVPAAGLNAPLQ